MTRPITHIAASALIAAAFAGSAHAAAADPASQDGGIAMSEPAPPAPESAPQSPFAASRAAGDDLLGRATAREDLSIVATSDQTSTVTDGTVTGTTSGDINFTDNAFQNATGLTVINANSGNNVAMNASLTVNVVMTAPQ